MSNKRIKVDELKLGMFIVELDISWIKSPFFRHKRLITKNEDIKLLKRAGVKELVIDMEKSEVVADESKKTKNKSVEKKTKVDAGPITIKQEVKAATKVKKEVMNAVNSLTAQVENGEPIELDVVSPIINKTIESLERNNQALLTLLHQGRKDSKLASHTFGVFTLAMILAKEQNLSKPDTEALGLAAMLHDSGWSKLPANLFAKGKKYTSSECTLARQHIVILEKILDKSDSIPEITRVIIQQHHELGDGSGFPKALKLAKIHPLARMLTICDIYDECVHGLGERRGMVAANAISEIFKLGKKGVLDEALTRFLAKTMGVYPLSSGVLLDNGEKALVIETNRDDPLLPTIKIYYDKLGNPKPKPVIVRLGKQKGERILKIDSVIDPQDPKVDPAGLLNLGEA